MANWKGHACKTCGATDTLVGADDQWFCLAHAADGLVPTMRKIVENILNPQEIVCDFAEEDEQ